MAHIPEIAVEGLIMDIPSLLSVTRNKLIPQQRTAHDAIADLANRKTEAKQLDVKCTSDFTIAINQVMAHLEQSNERFQLLFMQIALHQLTYNAGKKAFESIISLKKLERFMENTEEDWLAYEQQKALGETPEQVFVICLIQKRVPFPEYAKSRHFSHMIMGRLEFYTQKVKFVLTKFARESICNWDRLFKALKELSVVNIPELLNTKPEIHREEHDKSHSVIAFQANQNVIDILQTLRLRKWYPSLISMKEVMKVRKEIPTEEITATDLPWIILQKMIMVNFNARDKEISKIKKAQNTELDITDCFADIPSMFADEQSITLTLTPLDVFVTIFECCDLMLKQNLVQKMFACKLAVPLLYPQLSGDSFIFSLWALRNIVVEKGKKQKTVEVNIATENVSVVSFIRYGRPNISKSKHLNYLLNEQSHNTFYNKDCPGGDDVRSVSNGLVEASWYIPSGEEAEPFEELIMFLNLRGDAAICDKSVRLVSKISNVIVVFIDPTYLDSSDHLHFIEGIHFNTPYVIYILQPNVEKNYSELQAKLQRFNEAIGDANMKKTKGIMATTGKKGNKEIDKLSKEIQETIKTCLAGQRKKSILDFSYIAKSLNLVIDEGDRHCQKGKQLADELMSLMPGEVSKDEMLPLQGPCWLEWSKLSKLSARVTNTVSTQLDERDKITQSMDSLRKKQVRICQNLKPLVRGFVKVLNQHIRDPNSTAFFLHWLKMYLDEKSRKILPGLHRQVLEAYKAKRQMNVSKPNKQQQIKLQKLMADYEKAEQLLDNSTFGVEHLLREISQIYEAIMGSKCDVSPETKSAVEHLPQIAAELLLQGQPLEVMDGDALSVPITWITAVLQSINEKDKRVFVLSVIGIQSSGKSTLLNTMFGLQFAVSAGRCTRGLYMQLVQVDKESGLPFDFVLVVDTEGLRAHELGQGKHDHDNELATLVIGLGDVTIINIKGEIATDVTDILQITVHALLRMKLANRNIKL